MPVIKLEIVIKAPIERVFDLARCIDLHETSMSRHNERAVGGVTSGLINLGETVTWEATHFGVRQRLTSKITEYDRPKHFRDSMVSGAFRRFDHDHFFEEVEQGTSMTDVFDYTSPGWIVGWLADVVFLEKYMTGILSERNSVVARVAEGDDWRGYVQGGMWKKPISRLR